MSSFFEGPLLGLLGHPVQVGDRAAVGLEQVGDQLVHDLLRPRREVPGDVLAPHRLAEAALDETDTALPARTQLRRPGEGASVEVEVGLDERRGQVRRRRADRTHRQEGLPVLEAGLAQDGLEVLEVRRLPHHGLGQRLWAATHGGDPRVEVEAGQHRLQLRDPDEVVGLEHLAGVLALPVALRQARLERDHPRGGAGRVRALGQLEDALEVGEVLLADLGELLLAVVALVGQPDPALQHVDDVALGVAVVGVDVGAEQPAATTTLEGAEETGQRPHVGEGLDLLQQRQDRGVAEPLDALLVHEAGVEVADLARLVVVGGRACRDPPCAGLDDLQHLLLGRLGQQGERPPGGPVGRYLRGVEPPAVDVAEQVVLDTGVGVHALAGVVEHRHEGNLSGHHQRTAGDRK